jgi:hypothetical protein
LGLAANYEKEERALRKIQEILTRFEGKADAQPPLINIAGVLIKESFIQPMVLLDRIHELLEVHSYLLLFASKGVF